MVKNPPVNAEGTGSIPGLGRFPGEGDSPEKFLWGRKELDTTERLSLL